MLEVSKKQVRHLENSAELRVYLLALQVRCVANARESLLLGKTNSEQSQTANVRLVRAV